MSASDKNLPNLDHALDTLYGVAPSEFTPTRDDRLTAEAKRVAGEADVAERAAKDAVAMSTRAANAAKHARAEADRVSKRATDAG